MSKIIGVIPARYASTRFPGKPLVDIKGKSMIQRTYEQCLATKSLNLVVVATDDARIEAHVKAFGGNVFMTRDDHPSGTDRCAEVAENYPDYDYVINIQGDEPFIEPSCIDQLATLLTQDKGFDIATLCKQIDQEEQLFNPNVVKVIFSPTKQAWYFSRSTIPYLRDIPQAEWLRQKKHFKHLGIYGYKTTVLHAVAKLPKGKFEALESLEQLRWLEAGYQIGIDTTTHESIGIDTPEQLTHLLKTL